MDVRQRITDLVAPVRRAVEPLRQRVGRTLEGMSPRDRMLAYGLVIFFTVAVLGVGTAMLKGSLGRLEQDLASRQGQLALVQEMRASYEEGRTRLQELEERIRSHQGTTLSAFLEKSAERTQIRDNLKQVKERSTSTLENLEERQFTVQLSRVALEQLSAFLFEVETSGYPLLIRSAKIKTVVVGGTKLLDATLEISSFKLVEDAEVSP